MAPCVLQRGIGLGQELEQVQPMTWEQGFYFYFQITDENVVPCVLQKTLISICCIPVIFTTLLPEYCTIFFIFPSETDVRLISMQLCESLYLPFYWCICLLSYNCLDFFVNTSMFRFSPARCLWLGLVTVASG